MQSITPEPSRHHHNGSNETPPPFQDELTPEQAFEFYDDELPEMKSGAFWLNPLEVWRYRRIRPITPLWTSLRRKLWRLARISAAEFDAWLDRQDSQEGLTPFQSTPTARPPILWQRASDLQHEVIAPLRWCIDGLVSEGLFILAGRPKRGKSMLALNLALAKATGGCALHKYPVHTPGDVAYLALEDGKRRVKYRIEQLMPPDTPWPARLHVAYHAPRTNEGLAEELTRWADQVETPALVIVDILARITPLVDAKGSAYEAEYQVMAALMDWASHRQIAIGVIAHATKAKAEDVFETVMSTTANTGASATNMVLVRHMGDTEAILHLEGKDLAHQELALRSVDGFTWEYVGTAQDVQMSQERRELLHALYHSDGQAASRRQLADMLDVDKNTLNRRITRAQEMGYILLRDGKVALTDKAAVAMVEAEVRDRDVRL